MNTAKENLDNSEGLCEQRCNDKKRGINDILGSSGGEGYIKNRLHNLFRPPVQKIKNDDQHINVHCRTHPCTSTLSICLPPPNDRVRYTTPYPPQTPPIRKINGYDSIISTYEINTNSRNIRLRVGIISKPKEQTGFTNTRISNKKEFKEIVAEYK